MYILEVYIIYGSLKLNHSFTYLSESEVKPFCRVRVEFKKRSMLAFVAEVTYLAKTKAEIEAMYGYEILMIKDICDQEPIFSKELYDLALWLAKTTLSPLITVLNVMLPKAYKISAKEHSPVKEIRIKKLSGSKQLTLRQKEVLAVLKDEELLSEARKHSVGIVNKLLALGYLETYECLKKVKERTYPAAEFLPLTAAQKAAFTGILNSVKTVNLLYGVTGSGKTEVYLYLAREYLNRGKQVLILVPEIALTPQMIARVKSRFQDVAVYHSGLSDQKRFLTYTSVANGNVAIVIATRSGIFLPFKNLGLIIIDEEHDHSYKQDTTPCYDCRNVAFKRAITQKAKVLLAGATPSLLSYTRALHQEYGFFRLNERINHNFAAVKLIDMNTVLRKEKNYIISNELKSAIERTLKAEKQVIILLNRRGTAPIVKCAQCGAVLRCEDCDIALTYHKDLQVLKCHLCGRNYSLPQRCPKCGGKQIVQYGFGTKRVEEELHKLFQAARIIRMDADATVKKESHERILAAFEAGEYDIMVGTQMVAKGLDFPRVTLVGILNADAGLMHQDYNSTEACFDLLMQAAGRSGRSSDPGAVLLQAYNPDHYIFKAIKAHDYELFYRIEMDYRRKAQYPPYTHLLALEFADSSPASLKRSVAFWQKELVQTPLDVYQPLLLAKVRKLFRARILIKEQDLLKLLNSVYDVMRTYSKTNYPTTLKVDVDPLYLE